MRRLLCWVMCLPVGCAQIADLRDDPTLIEDGGGPQGCVPENLGTPGLCTDAKCTVVDPQSGTVGCGPRGTGSPYAGCDGDDDCADGTFCDRDWTTCKPFCADDDDCNGGKCLPATEAGDALEFQICAAMCDPVAATPPPAPPVPRCDEGAACFLRETIPVPIWDCGGSLGYGLGTVCTDGSRHCANGLACVDGRCQAFCFISDLQPEKCKNTSCTSFDDAAVFDTKPVGVCY